MYEFLCTHEGGCYTIRLTVKDALKRWSETVWQNRCQVFKLGVQVEYLHMDSPESPRWIYVKEKKA
jgi:hypothetical protein